MYMYIAEKKPLTLLCTLTKEFTEKVNPENLLQHTCTVCTIIIHIVPHTCSSYITVIGVHEIHGQMHPNGYVTNLFAVSLLSQLAYLTVSHTHPLASKMQ